MISYAYRLKVGGNTRIALSDLQEGAGQESKDYREAELYNSQGNMNL